MTSHCVGCVVLLDIISCFEEIKAEMLRSGEKTTKHTVQLMKAFKLLSLLEDNRRILKFK